MNARISIMGLYNYDETVLSKFEIPERLDREVVIGNLLLELCELEFLYPDITTAREAIGFWSRKNLKVWNKLIDTTLYDYDPIINFDRKETISDIETRNLSGSHKETRDLEMRNTETRDLSETNNQTNTNDDTTTNSGTDSVAESVGAFNQTSLASKSKTESTKGTSARNTGTVTTIGGTNDSGTVENEKTDSGTIDNSITDTGTIETAHTARMYGNIGITTTQQMIREEREVVLFNVIDKIINDFKLQFCLLVY